MCNSSRSQSYRIFFFISTLLLYLTYSNTWQPSVFLIFFIYLKSSKHYMEICMMKMHHPLYDDFVALVLVTDVESSHGHYSSLPMGTCAVFFIRSGIEKFGNLHVRTRFECHLFIFLFIPT